MVHDQKGPLQGFMERRPSQTAESASVFNAMRHYAWHLSSIRMMVLSVINVLLIVLVLYLRAYQAHPWDMMFLPIIISFALANVFAIQVRSKERLGTRTLNSMFR